MLKNISDYISLIVIVAIIIYMLDVLLINLLRKEMDTNTDKRLELIRDYIYNEEE